MQHHQQWALRAIFNPHNEQNRPVMRENFGIQLPLINERRSQKVRVDFLQQYSVIFINHVYYFLIQVLDVQKLSEGLAQLISPDFLGKCELNFIATAESYCSEQFQKPKQNNIWTKILRKDQSCQRKGMGKTYIYCLRPFCPLLCQSAMENI